MPPTRIVVLESRRRMEPRLRRGSADLPVEIRAARTRRELVDRLSGCPFPMAIIEHRGSIDETLEAVQAARPLANAILVVPVTPLSDFSSAAIRLAGTDGILHSMPSDDAWPAILRRWVNESQHRLALGNGDILLFQS